MPDAYLPAPGLGGDYEGSCVNCMKGTDTALGFEGEAEWLMAGLAALGVPKDQALVMVSQHFKVPPGLVPDGTFRMVVKVCPACVEQSPFPTPVLVLPGAVVPFVKQPRSSEDYE
jgi:hypothetical protein